MAVGGEWAHPKFRGQGHGGAVVRFGRRRSGMVMTRGNVAQQAKSPGLMATFPALAGKRQGAVGAGAGILDLVSASKEMPTGLN